MGNLLTTLKAHKDGVATAQFSKDGKMIVTSSHDNLIILWNASSPYNILAMLSGHT